jgi:hypothetical protein
MNELLRFGGGDRPHVPRYFGDVLDENLLSTRQNGNLSEHKEKIEQRKVQSLLLQKRNIQEGDGDLQELIRGALVLADEQFDSEEQRELRTPEPQRNKLKRNSTTNFSARQWDTELGFDEHALSTSFRMQEVVLKDPANKKQRLEFT